MFKVSLEVMKRAIREKEDELKEKFKKEVIVERELKIRKISTDVATIITGVRRCGKSILAFSLAKDKNFGYVNFEDERLQVHYKELNSVLEAIYQLKGNVDVIVFDEIQNIDKWELFINRLLANKKIIITGSNSRLLSKELATHLTGRHIDYTLFPFSFREYLLYSKFKPDIYLTKDIAKIKIELKKYIKIGGFPLTYKVGKRFLADNYKDIIERDVIQRYKVKYEKIIKELSLYYVSNFSSEISFNKIKNIFNVKSVITVKNYSDFLLNSFLFFILEKYSPKLKQQIIAPKKIYCIDNGIINSLAFKVNESFGRLIENLVAIELLRRKSYWFNNWEIYYWKDYQQREVDFVVKEGLRVKKLIQVTYASDKIDIEKRETDGLLKAYELFKKDKPELIIITWDYEDTLKENGKEIKCMPLWKWLLNV